MVCFLHTFPNSSLHLQTHTLTTPGTAHGGLQLPKTRLQYKKKSLSFSGAALWNSLPTLLRTASSICLHNRIPHLLICNLTCLFLFTLVCTFPSLIWFYLWFRVILGFTLYSWFALFRLSWIALFFVDSCCVTIYLILYCYHLLLCMYGVSPGIFKKTPARRHVPLDK